MTARQVYYSLKGGLDQETPAIAVDPGRAIAVLNHESAVSGYKRTQGYERFDGQPAPSAATFSTLTFTAGSTAFVAGQTVTGLTSGATARVLALAVLTSGAWTGTAAGTFPIHLIVGTFVVGESLRVGGVTVATLASLPIEGDGYESALAQTYLTLSRDYARSLIIAPVGTGAIRGLIWYGGKLNVWRDNGGVGVLRTSSAAGWVAPNLGSLLLFKTGTAAFVAGNTITGFTSGATAVIRQVALNAGTAWATGNAAGTVVLDSVVGVFQNGEQLRVGGTTRALADGVVSAATFPAGGRYEFVIQNFYGSVGYERVYGANAVGKAFEFDGSSIIPITTGMIDDRPVLIAEHKNHLFLAFPKGSLQLSQPGEPRSFTAVLGAAELGLGHEITNLIPNASSAMFITTDYSIAALTGNDISDFILETLGDDDVGAKANTAQRIGSIVYLDNRGVRSAASAQNYGNFKLGTFTTLIQKELDSKRSQGLTPVGSCVIKSKDQYLLFFSDGSGISLYFGHKAPEAMLFTYPFILSCDPHVIEIAGVERVFVGATDGFVYELNAGTSFDGAAIEAFLQLPFSHESGPRVVKRFHKAVVEATAARRTTLSVSAEFDYGSALQPYAHNEAFSLEGMGGLWNVASWDTLVWDSPAVAQAETYLQGLGSNMSLTIFSSSAVQDSYTLQGITVLFSPRGQKR